MRAIFRPQRRSHLHATANLLVAANDGVEAAFAGQVGQVQRVLRQVVALFGTNGMEERMGFCGQMKSALSRKMQEAICWCSRSVSTLVGFIPGSLSVPVPKKPTGSFERLQDAIAAQCPVMQQQTQNTTSQIRARRPCTLAAPPVPEHTGDSQLLCFFMAVQCGFLLYTQLRTSKSKGHV